MRLLKSVIAGVLAVVAAQVVVIVLVILVPFAVAAFQAKVSGGGVGGIAFSLNTGVPLVIAVVAGAAGFLWQWRRGRRTPGLTRAAS